MQMTEDKQIEIRKYLSESRIASYANSDSLETQLNKYNYNIKLCKAFYSSLNYFEISFRNAIDIALTEFSGEEDWLDALPLNIESQRKISDAKGIVHLKQHPITHDRIISELSLGFWTALFSKKYTQCEFQGYLIKKVFKNCPKESRNIKNIQRIVDSTRELRNRICHYERISHLPNLQTKHDNLLESIKWISLEIFSLAEKIDTFSQVTL